MSTEHPSPRRRGLPAPARVAIGLAVLVGSVVVVLVGMIVFAGELAPGGQRGSLAVMALWFTLLVVAGFLIQRRVRFLRWPLAVGILGPIIAVMGFLTYTNFTDRVVDENVAVVGETAQETQSRADGVEANGAEPGASEPQAAPSEPVNTEIAAGAFTRLGSYDTMGTATAIDLADGGRVLTLTDFETSNGPDLLVYLVSGDVNSNGDGDDFVNLGVLKGNIGDQQYDIPDGVDLAEFDSVVIWCRAFSAGFGVAELSPAGPVEAGVSG